MLSSNQTIDPIVDDLVEKVRQQAPRIGRMTVYRTLDLLCELGVVHPIYQ